MTADLDYILRRLDDAAAELATSAAILSALHEARALDDPRVVVTPDMLASVESDVVRWSEELRCWAGAYERAARGESYACPHFLDLEPEYDGFALVDDLTPAGAPERAHRPAFEGSTVQALAVGLGVLA